MTEEKERLVLDNLRLAGYMAQKYKSTGIDFDELTSISYMGLVKAANSYQPERGKSSSVFFSQSISSGSSTRFSRSFFRR